MSSSVDKPEPATGRLVPRPVLLASIALAALAWLCFIVFQIAHRPAEPLLWILSGGWPFVYGFSLIVSLGIVSINREGPLTSHWPSAFRVIFPKPLHSLVNAFYAAMGPIMMIAFPLGATLLGGVMVYLVLTGQA